MRISDWSSDVCSSDLRRKHCRDQNARGEVRRRSHRESGRDGRMSAADMSLDETEDRFTGAPDNASAADLLTVATKYWNDDMIGDETFSHNVTLVCDWLRQNEQAPSNSSATSQTENSQYKKQTITSVLQPIKHT